MSTNNPNNDPEFTLETALPVSGPQWPVEKYEILEWVEDRLQQYTADFQNAALHAAELPPLPPIPAIEETTKLLAAMPPDIGQRLLQDLHLGYAATDKDIYPESQIKMLPVFKIMKTMREKLMETPGFAWNPPEWEEMKKDPKKLYALYVAHNESSKQAMLAVTLSEASKCIIEETTQPDSFSEFENIYIQQCESLGRDRLEDWWGGYEISQLRYSLRSDSLSSVIMRTIKNAFEDRDRQESNEN